MKLKKKTKAKLKKSEMYIGVGAPRDSYNNAIPEHVMKPLSERPKKGKSNS